MIFLTWQIDFMYLDLLGYLHYVTLFSLNALFYLSALSHCRLQIICLPTISWCVALCKRFVTSSKHFVTLFTVVDCGKSRRKVTFLFQYKCISSHCKWHTIYLIRYFVNAYSYITIKRMYSRLLIKYRKVSCMALRDGSNIKLIHFMYS